MALGEVISYTSLPPITLPFKGSQNNIWPFGNAGGTEIKHRTTKTLHERPTLTVEPLEFNSLAPGFHLSHHP